RPRIYRTEALVLKGYDYGEADRILSLYTPQAGIVRAIAKGVRRTRSRKAGHLDLFTRSNLLLARGRQLDVITQAETIESFQGMREDLWRSSQAHYVAELVESFGAEQLANYPVYALTVATLRRLASADRTGLAVRAFELQLLSMTGYRPQLHRCLHCDTLIAPQVNRFSPRMGGVLCPDCASVDTAAPPISVAALKLMRNLQTNENAVLQLTRLDDGVEGEVQRRLQEYIVHRLERLPRSIAVLEKLRIEGAFQR
ncbi:MAG: DNA repair protein RecO, partial [Chloroflexi bacterium]|nr:DNA repair protein RecO [Chloroflexota bacterium]